MMDLEETKKMAAAWAANDKRNKKLTEANAMGIVKPSPDMYPDGTPKTFREGRPDLNSYGYQHATERCQECGEWECDFEGVGHYRG